LFAGQVYGNFFSQIFDMKINGPFIPVKAISLDHLNELCPGKNPIGAAH
jgi:hypothetical protein